MQAKSSDGKEAFSKKRNDSLQNLKSSLIKKWTEKKVDLCYQNTVLSYISDMLPQQAEQEILIEKEKLIENKAEYLKIQRLRQQRELIMGDLEDSLKDQSNIRLACDGVDKLRKINLKICEAILNFKDKLKQRDIKNDAILKGYGHLLLILNQDNKLIVNSYMSNFIQFTIGYDPFFLYPYEKLESGRVSDDTPQPVIKLFKMNISYVYRLIKAKKEINELLNQKNREMTIQQTESNRESHKQSQNQKQQSTYMDSSKFNKIIIKKKRKIILPSHKYQTINHEVQDSDYLKNSSLRVQSQPKQSMKSSFIGQELEKKQRSGPKKFRIRDKSQSEKSNSLRFRSQNYDHAEDEDINEFRRKMFQRRARRNRLQINTRKVEQQEELLQKRTQLKKNSLNLKKYSQIMVESGSANLRKNWNLGDQQASSEQEQLMQSRNLEQGMKNSQMKQKFNKIRYNMRKKNQFIKLQPLDKAKINDKPLSDPDQEEDDPQLSSHLNLSKSFLEQKQIKKNFLPLSPSIKQMNKQSSSGKSQQENSQSEETYKGDKKQQIFQDINTKDEISENSMNFRVKKLESIDLSSNTKQKNAIKEYAEQKALNPVDEKKFRDEHLRNPKAYENNLKKMRQGQSRSIENKNENHKTNEQKNEAISKEKITKLQINKMLQQKAERQKQNPSKQQEIPTYRYHNQTQSNYPSNLAPYRVITNNKILDQIEEMEQNKNKNKQIKLKPGQINVDDLFTFIQRQKINQFQRKQFEVGLWKQNIILKHSYLTKFYMNSQLAAFGISSPRRDGDYSILYWGTTCPQNFTFFLFKKYLDYLEKFTSLNNIYIGNPDYKEAEFQKKGAMYQRKRKNFQKRSLPYFPFLSLQCSNICFSQEIDKKNSIFFYSQQISQFTSLNSLPNNFVGFCDPQSAAALPTNAQFHQKISSIAEVNGILQKLEIDTFATSEKIQIKECKVFTLKDHCAIKSNYFYIRNGYFAPKGTQVYSKEKEKIMKLDMDKQQYSLFFGKKIKNIESFVSNCNFNPGSNNFFAFKMFSKQLYGRIKNKQFTSQGCYGNWDINFLWQDQLKGTVIKEMPAPQYIFGPQSFFVALFKAETFIFAFEVQPSDFFF